MPPIMKNALESLQQVKMIVRVKQAHTRVRVNQSVIMIQLNGSMLKKAHAAVWAEKQHKLMPKPFNCFSVEAWRGFVPFHAFNNLKDWVFACSWKREFNFYHMSKWTAFVSSIPFVFS